MISTRSSLIAGLTRLYPLYSGGNRVANLSWIQKLADTSTERVWSHVPGGEVLASLNEYVGRTVFYLGDLDRKITWTCTQIVRPGDVVLDIGANIGIVTLLLSKLVGETGKVHAFEPNPELQETLKETLERNKRFNVQLHPVALGSQEGQLELRIPRYNVGAGSLVRNKDFSDCDVFEVPVRNLSEIVAQEKIKSIRLIKIDVEGFEAEVLKGGQQVFELIRPEAVLFELNREQGLIRDQPVIKILRDFEYDFFTIPKCLFGMYLKRFNANTSDKLVGHDDLLAAPKGECYEKIAALVKASV